MGEFCPVFVAVGVVSQSATIRASTVLATTDLKEEHGEEYARLSLFLGPLIVEIVVEIVVEITGEIFGGMRQSERAGLRSSKAAT